MNLGDYAQRRWTGAELRGQWPRGVVTKLVAGGLITHSRRVGYFASDGMDETIRYFDWNALFSTRRRNLPHFCQEGAVYFVTFRLDDSIPQTRLDYWRWQYQQWLKLHPPPHDEAELEQIKELGLRRVERFLDRGHGACLLKTTTAQDAVEKVMRNRDEIDYALGDYVIVPNHVHVLFRPLAKVELGGAVAFYFGQGDQRNAGTSR